MILVERFNFSQRHSGELLSGAQDIINKDMKVLIKVKMGEIVGNFLRALQRNAASTEQTREETSKIFSRFEEFVLEIRNG